MERNVGGLDRTARLIIGPILLVVALAIFAQLLTVGEGSLYTLWLPLALLAVGGILTVTGAVQRCPANSLFGLDTYRR
jgi:hypothetical protein